jgi:hypothetical protein
MDCNIYEFLVSVLSILVTILIAYQIFNIINFNSEKNKINKFKKELNNKFNDFLIKYEKDISNLKYAEEIINQKAIEEAIKIISNIESIQLMSKRSRVSYITHKDFSNFPFNTIDVYENKPDRIIKHETYKYNYETKELYVYDILDKDWDKIKN